MTKKCDAKPPTKKPRKSKVEKKPIAAKQVLERPAPHTDAASLKTRIKPERGGHFVPGGVAGPGRPRGSRNAATKLIEDLLEDKAQALTERLIRRAMGGSTEALKIVFNIMAPARKDRLVEIELPKIETADDLVTAHGVIIKAVAKGQISPGEAHSVAALLDFRRRAVESIQVEERLAAIEARIAEQGGQHHVRPN